MTKSAGFAVEFGVRVNIGAKGQDHDQGRVRVRVEDQGWLRGEAELKAHMEPMPPMPPPTMPPPCTKGPSLPAMTPAPMANTMPVSFATSVRIVSNPLRR